jgi:enoyl-CoA hydratase
LRSTGPVANPDSKANVKESSMHASANDEVLIRREGRAGRITMNRAGALNALTHAMVGQIWQGLTAWQNDAAVALIILDGAGDRALCAGGDVRGLYDSRTAGSALARAFWRDEYRLNAMIAHYGKPYVALMDGIVMGGGIGLSAHASHRIVTDRSLLAMPETGIGLIPDVGGTWLLSRQPPAPAMPREAGTYLALTGQRFNGREALDLGFADALVDAPRLTAMVAQLIDSADPDAAMIRYRSSLAGRQPAALCDLARPIDAAFGFDRVEDILAALETMPGAFATKTLADLHSKSPLALKLTLEALRRARTLACLEDALNMEYRLTVRLFECGEFAEGVRALLIDKDKRPRWNPPRLQDVTPAMVQSFFAPLPPGEELGLQRLSAR